MTEIFSELTNKSSKYMPISCKNCNSSVKPFFSLGDMPLANGFLTAAEIPKEKKYDLTVGFCPKCFLVQLVNTVSPEKLFRDYIYLSSTSLLFLKHCEEASSRLIKKLNLTPKKLVLEIASNDGAFLTNFKKRGIKILGIDPAKNIAATANQKGIKTIPEFFNNKMAEKLRKKKITADLVYGANVLAHVPGIVDFVRGVKTVLADNGTAVFEFPYVRGLMENKFDTIYHEHVFYYSLLALRNIFNNAGLEIYDVEETPMQGGSLLIYASHQGVFPVTRNVKNLVFKEKRLGYHKISTYKKMEQNIAKLKTHLHDLLATINKDRKTVAVYGAPAKGNILLNYFGIADKILFLVDKSTVKQGLYTPGTHLKVEAPSVIKEKRPDYLLILCWNIADEIIKEQAEYKNNGGKFIIPIPKVNVI